MAFIKRVNQLCSWILGSNSACAMYVYIYRPIFCSLSIHAEKAVRGNHKEPYTHAYAYFMHEILVETTYNAKYLDRLINSSEIQYGAKFVSINLYNLFLYNLASDCGRRCVAKCNYF